MSLLRSVEPTAHPESESSAPGDEGVSWARRHTGAGCASVPPAVQCPLDRAFCGPLLSLGPEARAPAGVPTGGRKGGVMQQRSVVSALHTAAWSAPLCEECWRVGEGIVVGRSQHGGRENHDEILQARQRPCAPRKRSPTREGKEQFVRTYEYPATLTHSPTQL